MNISDWAIWLEEKYRLNREEESQEVEYFSKDSREGWFSQLYYSTFTGWSQVLFYSENTQTETVTLRIDYYPTALEAICDNSIFPSGLIIRLDTL